MYIVLYCRLEYKENVDIQLKSETKVCNTQLKLGFTSIHYRVNMTKCQTMKVTVSVLSRHIL